MRRFFIMKKGKLYRSVLAMGMALSLTAAPMSAMAESVDETEIINELGDEVGDALESTVGESVNTLTSSAYESTIDVIFGEGMYKLAAQDGTDASWLENATVYLQASPQESGTDLEFTVGVNDTEVFHVILSIDGQAGILYVSIPELFAQPAAINAKELMNSVMSGAQSSGSEESEDASATSMIMEIVMGMASQLVADAQTFFASIPAETWQQEFYNYVMPLLGALEQSENTGTLTVGGMEADVKVQTLSISSESLAQIIPELLNMAAQDELLKSVCTSDFFNNALGIISMVSGGSVSLTGDDVYALISSTLEEAASYDYSGVPGFSVSIMSSDDNSAFGLEAYLVSGSENYNLYTLYAISNGSENAIQITPGQFMLPQYGLSSSDTASVVAHGTVENDILNEEIDVVVNDICTGIVTLEDFDMKALTQGKMIGDVRIQLKDLNLLIKYGVEDDGTRTICYYVNDELFYDLAMWESAVDSTQIDPIDYENAIAVSSLEDLISYLETIDTQNLMNVLAEAGIPVNTETTTAA